MKFLTNEIKSLEAFLENFLYIFSLDLFYTQIYYLKIVVQKMNKTFIKMIRRMKLIELQNIEDSAYFQANS